MVSVIKLFFFIVAYTDTIIIALLPVSNCYLQTLCYYLATTAYGTKPHAAVHDLADILVLACNLTLFFSDYK
jgi:hypothetical protein